ncbi:M43 family zinc metalloprotease, partial [Flavobacterium sp.]|uniref:M43 family zinc metalloprotease n=1 Tax=Flavobacterium sp. TaxID=239 RepID=UPI002A7F8493
MSKSYLLACVFLLSFMTSISAQNNQLSNTAVTKQFGREIESTQELTPSGHIRCSSTEYEAYLKKQYPKRATTNEFEDWLAPKINEYKRQIANGTLNRATVLTIPVVVHVIHNGDALGTGENINDAQVLSQIRVLNEDFRKILGTPGYNTNPVGADIEIEFCMAQTDPLGNTTSGINRVNGGSASYDSMAATNTMKANTSWDPTQYLNMWSVRFGGGMAGTLGFAQFPDSSGLAGLNASGGAANTDGVVSSFDAFGSQAYAAGSYNPTYNLGRTMTHEVGHWMGLRHIWGDGACGVDDFCADTPESDASNFGCPTTHVSCGTVDMVQNYMDYTDDSCMNIFTQDQKTRIRTVFTVSPRRASLASSTKCQGPSPIIRFTNPTGSINEGTNCSFTDVTFPITIGKVATANATVTFNVTDVTATQNVDYTIVNPTVTFPTGSTTTQNLTIRVYNDGLVEGNETFDVTLTLNANGGDAVLNNAAKTMTITIVNNDIVPTVTQTNTILTEDFETATGWTIVDTNADTWGLVTGANGIGTAPNTIVGGCAYSEKSRTYLGGTGSATPNNYIVSPQVTIPVGATSVNLSYILAGYGATSGNFIAYFTTTLNPTTAAQITSGTIIQASTTQAAGTSSLKNHNMLPFAGQTGHIAFAHINNNTATGLLLLDSVLLQSVTSTLVQTDVNTATLYQATIQTSGTAYATDASTGKVMASVVNTGGFNYGCTSVSVNRSQVSIGAATTAFIDANVSNAMLAKTFNVTTASDTPSGAYTVKFYFTEAEVAAWETATGKTRSQLNIIKVQNNNISVVNASNYTSYVIEEKPVTITSFGANVVFEASFTTRMSGGYAVGPKTGINCGDIASTWNGSVWSNGAPSKVTAVTFAGTYNSSANVDACSATINSGINVTFNAGHTLNVNNAVIVNGTGSLIIQNNAGLRQLNDAAINTGNIIVRRVATPTIRLDYTAWSSPVVGQQLQAFSPNTVSTRFYQYLYTGTTTPTAYQSVTATTNF